MPIAKSGQKVDVSVVICTHNRPVDLAANLPHVVSSGELSRHSVEVVVVDNAPADSSTEAVVSRHPCRYVQEPRKGLGHARNVGVGVATGAVILFADDDVEVPANWVDEMSRPLLGGECDIVAGAVVPAADRIQPWMGKTCIATAGALATPLHGEPSEVVGASFGARRDVFDRIGFNQDLGAGTPLGSGEDVFFYVQAKALGMTALGCATAPVTHLFDTTRLTRDHLALRASAIGRTAAHIDHHWRQRRGTWLLPRIALDWIWVQKLRWRSVGEVGMRDPELERRMALAYKMQMLREQGSRSRYKRPAKTVI